MMGCGIGSGCSEVSSMRIQAANRAAQIEIVEVAEPKPARWTWVTWLLNLLKWRF